MATKLQSISAMAFYHPDGLVAAWKQASKFASGEGRIATLPDIIDARLATEPGSVPWERYFTTRSAEYVGKSKGGNRIIIVAHGVGPMATLDSVLEAYKWCFSDKNRDRRGGRITEEEFHKLESGQYGPVGIVDFDDYVREYQYPFIENITPLEARWDKLLKARLGPRAAEYVARHVRFAREWHTEQIGIDPDNRYNLPGHASFLDRRRTMHLNFSKPDSSPYILRMGDASNCSYRYYPPDEGMAFAHLLTIGGLMNLHHEGNESLVSEVNCHEWSNGVRFAGARSGVLSTIHSGPDNLCDLVKKFWQSLMQPVAKPVFPGNFYTIMTFGNEMFTMYPKVGERMDTHEPEFRVTSIKQIGRTKVLKTTQASYSGFFKYGIREVQAIAPRGANAYRLIRDGWLSKKRAYWQAKFYKIEVDTSARLIRESDLVKDYDALMALVERNAESE